MASTFVALIALILGGVTKLAYSDPIAYRRLHPFLMCAVVFFLVIVAAWDFGTKRAATNAIPYFADGKVSSGIKAIEASVVMEPWWFFGAALLLVYLMFLSVLPRLREP